MCLQGIEVIQYYYEESTLHVSLAFVRTQHYQALLVISLTTPTKIAVAWLSEERASRAPMCIAPV